MMLVESELEKGLPKTTRSICPECGITIDAKLLEKDGKVIMRKKCPEHGKFQDVIWSDVKMYLRAEKYAWDGIGIENPAITKPKEEVDCPRDCGLCTLHTTHTQLALLDLTNRCNLTCPVCFANANAAGYVFEPTFDEVVGMMQTLIDEKPVKVKGIQFAGGEPTIHPEFFRILAKAKEMGFSQIQIATNGIKFVEDPDFADKCQEAGLNTLYLQFGGLDDDMYKIVRGHKMADIKRKVVEAVRNTKHEKKMSIVLVPTIVNTINDHMIGDILKYALDNIDIILSVNFQPVSFSGRISKKELKAQRFTLSDLPDRVAKQTGWDITPDDFYPVPSLAVLSDLISLLKKEPKTTFTNHPHCGISTFVLYDKKKKKVIPITRIIDMDALFEDARKGALKIEGATIKGLARARVGGGLLWNLKHGDKYIRRENVPEGMDIYGLIKPLFTDGDKSAMSKITWSALMIGAMHFQDAYNYDIERVKRCGIHYVTPDGRIIPFCAYNTGPVFRESVEKKFSIPKKQWLKEHPGQKIVEPSPLIKLGKGKEKA